MTTRLNALADRIAGQGFGLTNYGNLEADTNYMVVPGADLASAAALTITNRFHGVTGTTSVSTITDALGAVEGQIVELWIKNGPLTIQSGTGNIKTATGSNRVAYGGEIVVFRYDGATWREQRPVPGARVAYGKNTSNVTTTGTTFAAGADLLAAALSFTADGSSDYMVRVSGAYWSNSAAGSLQYLKANLDGADAGYIAYEISPGAGYAMNGSKSGLIPVPGAGAHTINVRLVVAGGTGTVGGGVGGAGVMLPMTVTVEVA